MSIKSREPWAADSSRAPADATGGRESDPERSRLDELAGLHDVAREQDRRHALRRDVPWPDDVRMAVNFTVDFDAMLLRRVLDEPAMQRAKGEYGGRVGIWRLIELFDSHQVKGTVFAPGRICELYPKALKAAADSGHEIGDHMWEHRVPDDPVVERAHLERATAALERLTGIRPVGTRSYHSPDLLHELGYVYNSVEAADHRPYTTTSASGARLLELPFHHVNNDSMYYNFAFFNSENSAQRITDPDRVFDVWWDGFWQQYQEGGYMNICLHPESSGRALRVDMLDRLINRMKTLPGVWFPSCAEVAAHYSSQER
nr:polysaccharide deacetylase family protein [Rhodococcus sp. (in: high G+C Gram-positive bacteria)]